MDYTNDDQEVWLRIYRKTAGNGIYTRETEDIITRQYEVVGDLANFGATCDGGDPPYCCETLRVAYPVEKNDVIGVCMRDAGKHDPLYSLDSNAPGYTVYQYLDTDDCNKKGDIQTFTLSPTDLTPLDNFGLHAQLDIIGNYVNMLFNTSASMTTILMSSHTVLLAL